VTTGVKPLLLGYQLVRIDTPRIEVTNGRRLLKAYAARRGFALGPLYIEQNVNEPCSALVAVIDANAQRSRPWVTAVGVARATDLGRLRRVQRLTSERLERECGVPVLVAEWHLTLGGEGEFGSYCVPAETVEYLTGVV
jgi:hypothetical protein